MIDKQHIKNPLLAKVRTECFMLCDFASAESDKLHIIGGGWDRISPTTLPAIFSFWIAIKVVVPGQMILHSFDVQVVVVDPDGRRIGEPIVRGRIRGTPRADADDDLPEASAFLALNGEMEATQAGTFAFQLLVEHEPVASTRLAIAPLTERTPGVAESTLESR
jgi:hypothetical protein